MPANTGGMGSILVQGKSHVTKKEKETVMFSYLEYICPRKNIDVISTFSFIYMWLIFLRHILA